MEITQPPSTFKQKAITFLKLAGIAYLIITAFSLSLTGIFELFGIELKQPYMEDIPPSALFIIGVILAPILETAIMVGILWLVRLFASKVVAMIATAIAFSALHIAEGVHWGVLLGTGVIGYLFCYFYYRGKNQQVNGFWLMALIHALYNCTALALNGMFG